MALVDIFQRAGLPAGVLNMVMGPGATLGAALASSPELDAISFTGSQAVGRTVAAAGVANGARVQLEMGGKNPLIVLDDADLAMAVSCAVNGAYFQDGAAVHGVEPYHRHGWHSRSIRRRDGRAHGHARRRRRAEAGHARSGRSSTSVSSTRI